MTPTLKDHGENKSKIVLVIAVSYTRLEQRQLMAQEKTSGMSIFLKPAHGFNTAVLTHKQEAKPFLGAASSICENTKNRGLFLISGFDLYPLCKEKQRVKKTRNRKTITRDETITINGVTYSVNAKKSGLYVEILKRMIEQFEVALILWKRVLVVRFDLHLNAYTSDNKPVSNFVKRLTMKLKRNYGVKKIGYCWVREQGKAKAQHYHAVIFLDGRRARHCYRVIEIIKDAWQLPGSGNHVPHIPRPFYFGSRHEIAEKVVYRISYMAKPRGKGILPDQTKDYQCSRM